MFNKRKKKNISINRLHKKKGVNSVVVTIILVVVAFAIVGMFSLWLDGGIKNAMQGNDLMGVPVMKPDDFNTESSDFEIYSMLPESVQFPNSRNGWCQVGEEIYIFGGADFITDQPTTFGNYHLQNKAYKYNIRTNKWTRLADLPYWVDEYRAVHYNGDIYIIGGAGFIEEPTPEDTVYTLRTNSSLKYNIATNTYVELTPPAKRIAYTSGVVLVDKKIYAFSEVIFHEDETPELLPVTNVFIYDIETDLWSEGSKSNIKFNRGFAVHYNGLIYVQRSHKFQAYDIVNDTWITTLQSPTYDNVHTGVPFIYKDKMFIGSGWQTSAGINSPYIQYYNFAANEWHTLTSLELNGDALGYGSMFLYNEQIYYVGGYSNDRTPYFNHYVLKYNLKNATLD